MHPTLQVKRVADAVEPPPADNYAALELAGDGAFVVSSDGPALRVVHASASLALLCGRPRAELVGSPLAVLLPELAQRLHEPRALQCDCRLFTSSGHVIWVTVSLRPDPQQPGHCVGVVLDSSEHQQDTGNLERSQDRLRALLDAALDVITVLDERGNICYTNAAARNLLGYSPEDLLGTHGFDLVHPEDRPLALAQFARIAADPRTPDRLGSYRMRHKDGSYLHCEALTRNATANPAINGFIICLRDITQRVEAEVARRDADELLAFAARAASIGAWEWNPATDEVSADDAVRQLTRRDDRDRWEGMEAFARRLHPDDVPAFRQAWLTAARSPHRGHATVRLQLHDGSHRWLAMSAQMTERPGRGQVVLGLLADVTEQKRTEELARQGHEDLETVIWGAGVGLWTWQPQEGLETYDERTAELLGMPANQAMPDQAVRGNIHPDDIDRYAEHSRQLRSGAREDADIVFRAQRPDGSWRWLLERCRISARDADGRVSKVRGVTIDISQQRQAELQSALRKERLESAMWAGEMGIWEWFPQRDLETFDATSARLYGLETPESTLTNRRWRTLLHPDDVDQAQRATETVTRGDIDVYDVEFRTRSPDGQWLWRRDRGRVVARDAEGRPERLVGITMDIDERKRAELEVQERELRLDLTLKAAQLGSWEWELAADTIRFDERYAQILGLPERQTGIKLAEILDMIPPDQREAQQQLWQDLREGRTRTADFHSQRLRPDGRLAYCRVQGLVIAHGADGTPLRVVGTIADLTEQERARLLMLDTHRAARIGGYDFNVQNGRIIWTPGLYHLMGIDESFLPDIETTRSLVLDTSRARVLKFIDSVVHTGEAFDIEFEARHGSGRAIWVRMTGRSESFGGKVIRIHGTVQDISDRRALEQELLQATNAEQQRLGQELHDGLGQQLAGIAMSFQGMSQKIRDRQPELSERIDQANRGLQGAIQSTRLLAHGLAPVSIERGGLVHGLRMLAADAGRTELCSVRLHEALVTALTLETVACGHLYRIAQEAIHNAIRHGKASRVDLELRSTAGAVKLRVDDNGSGMPVPPPPAGLGMRSMGYRAKALNGGLLVLRSPGGGVRIEVDCPQPRRQAQGA